MPKDLMNRFTSLYEQHHSPEENSDELDFLLACDDLFEYKELPKSVDTFLEKVTNLHLRLDLMRTLTSDLQSNQLKIVDEAIKSELLHKEHDQLLVTIKQTYQYINQDIQKLKKETTDLNKYGIVTTEEKIMRDQVNVLVVLFQEVMVEYNRVQMDHRDKCKARIKRQLEISERVVQNDELEEMLETGNFEVFHKQIIFDDIHKAGESLRTVENRHADIIKLEQSIQDLFVIFQEISILIGSQGDMIGNIERNVEETVDNVEQSKIFLKKATCYRNRGAYSNCCNIL